jgi:hypothetical protein
MFNYSLERICSNTASLAGPLEVFGPVPEGSIKLGGIAGGWSGTRKLSRSGVLVNVVNGT